MLLLFRNLFYLNPSLGPQPDIKTTPIPELKNYMEVTTTEAHNSICSLFILIMQIFLSSSYAVMLGFQLEKPVFIREYSSQLYSLWIYYTTKNLVEIPMMIIAPAVQLCMVFWFVGYKSGILSFGEMYLMLMLVSLNGAGLGFMVSSISNNINQNSTIATMLTMPILAFTGLLVVLNTLPVWFSWI